MYNRAYRQRRPPTVPINYSGNAFERSANERGNFDVMPIPSPPIVEASFKEQPFKEQPKEEPRADIREETHKTMREKTEECEKREEKGRPDLLSGLFGGKLFPRGIGNEELLLFALILLVAQSGEADELLIYLVILLLT